MAFLYLKAVHIIFIVTWFAGLFYIPRLYIYIIESAQKSEPEKTILNNQLLLMAKRLWFGITWPSAIITLGMGVALLINQPFWLNETFMIIKLVLVGLLYGYHFSLHYIFNQLRKNRINYTSQQMRVWNEVATLFLIGIVFLIVLKSALSMVWGLAGLLVITTLIMIGIYGYRKFRKG
jgi:protoporphyrinogen IX oxidase